MIKQFFVYHYATQLVVEITNTVFNDVDSILVAPLKLKGTKPSIGNLQVNVDLEGRSFYVDLLDLATVSKRLLKQYNNTDLKKYNDEIKSGIDLLIDGF